MGPAPVGPSAAPAGAGQPAAQPPTAPAPEEAIHLPAPSVWPMALGGAVTLLFLGVVTSYALSAAGAVLFVLSLVGWIGELRHESAHADGHHDG